MERQQSLLLIPVPVTSDSKDCNQLNLCLFLVPRKNLPKENTQNRQGDHANSIRRAQGSQCHFAVRQDH